MQDYKTSPKYIHIYNYIRSYSQDTNYVLYHTFQEYHIVTAACLLFAFVVDLLLKLKKQWVLQTLYDS